MTRSSPLVRLAARMPRFSRHSVSRLPPAAEAAPSAPPAPVEQEVYHFVAMRVHHEARTCVIQNGGEGEDVCWEANKEET